MLRLISQDIKAIARRTLEEIFPRGDVAALAEVVHPNFVDHDGPPGAPPGLDGMAWSMRMLQAAFSDRRWEIHQVIAEDDTVVLYCTFHGRHTGEFMGLAPTSRSFAFRQVHIVRFQDGMGIEHWAVPDDLDLARQLGAIPRPPSQPVFADALAQLLRTRTHNVPLMLRRASQRGPRARETPECERRDGEGGSRPPPQARFG